MACAVWPMRVECWSAPMEHAVDASTCMSVLLRRGPRRDRASRYKAVVSKRLSRRSPIRVLKIDREESRRHIGVGIKRQGHAQARQDDGL